MRRIFRIFLFFVFFVSFCVINIPKLDWGLQVSWFIALVLITIYPLVCNLKIRIHFTRNFKIVSFFFFSILVITFLSWIFQYFGIIKFSDIDNNELFARSFSHTIYIIFEYLIFLNLVVYLQHEDKHIRELKYFIVYPFFFITFWGIYQWITTFDVVQYLEIFNNSLSTKFTYLRFKGEHRTSSVFPEPSEYAYFLAFMLPFALEHFYKTKNSWLPYGKYCYIFILSISILLCQSMSLFLVLPIILLYLLRSYIKFTSLKFILVSIFAFIGIVFIYLLKQDRFSKLLAGEDGSALIRYEAFMETLSLIKESPIIGAGFGAVRGLDLISFMLGTTGLVGTLIFIWTLFYIRPQTHTNLLFFRGFKCMMIVALISNPIIDLTFFWIILAFICTPIYVR